MVIEKLKKEEYAGKKFEVKYFTNGYYDIERVENGFEFQYKAFENRKKMSFEDCFYSKWLENPIAFGAFEDGKLLGFVEGTPEQWNNRYRISNICIFSEDI